MNIINERIEAICKEFQDIEDDYTRARTEGAALCNYINELEIKIERLEKEKEQFKNQLIKAIQNG